ncbi:GNAT family N-acetyltransferase [Oceanobacillus neutriphilus]|uniref:Glycosyl transferase n=1 Tax=Oceanobacillus neutriphilus TaxID=531815 RepID=A0ABQ2NZ13_9BACI|nr:GNAT family N-acetyltransferase [Oceanobacillus neutriphilus]GGP14025.1 glycosyl transferase [Oceanobacillus neutriphilus]
MEVILHKDEDAVERLFSECSIFNEKTHEFTIFQEGSWMKNWWEYQKNCKTIHPYMIEVKEGMNTIAIVPLYSYKATWSFTVIRPIGLGAADYLVPVISKKYDMEEIFNLIIKKLIEDRRKWDCIVWSDLPGDSIYNKIFSDSLLDGFKMIEKVKTVDCPYIILDQNMEQEKFGLNNKYVKKILFKQRKLIRQKGEYLYQRVRRETDIEPVMNKLFELHQRRWNGTETPSKYNNRKEREYALLTAKNLFQNELLHLSYLEINKQIIAVHFGMTDGNRFYFYIPSFDTEFGKYSAGQLLIYHLILDAGKEGCQHFDFLKGEEAYKYKWGAVNRQNVEYTFTNKTLKSQFFHFLFRINKSRLFHVYLRKIAERLLIRKTS